MTDDVHATPCLMSKSYGLGAEWPHESSPTCWCEPTLDYEDPETGARVWVHKRPQ